MNDLLTAQELKDRMDSNDNRCTAKPYLLLLRRRRIYVADDEYGGKERWVENYSGDCHTFDTREEAIACFKGDIAEYSEFDGCEDGNIDQAIVEFFKIKPYAEGEYFETENVFLTDIGYKEHMEANGHNLRGGHDTYGIHAFRNREIKSLFALIDKTIELEKENAELKDKLAKAIDSLERIICHVESGEGYLDIGIIAERTVAEIGGYHDRPMRNL